MGGANRSKCIDRITGLEFTEVSRMAHDERETVFSKLGGTALIASLHEFFMQGLFYVVFYGAHLFKS